jgi:hypothetical protein
MFAPLDWLAATNFRCVQMAIHQNTHDADKYQQSDIDDALDGAVDFAQLTRYFLGVS